MKQHSKLHDIFSKKKRKKEKIPQTKIIVDNREKNSLVYASLFELDAKTSFEQLEVGDYIIEDLVIERKTFTDFVASIIDRRLFHQLGNLRDLDKKLFILENFDHDYSKFSIHANAIRGALLSIALDFNLPLIFSKGETETAQFLYLIAKKQGKNSAKISLRPSRKLKGMEDKKQFILEGFPGIGPTIAKELLKTHKSLKNIFSLSKEELRKIPRFHSEKIDGFLNILKK